jgi:hypothetical protein
MVVGDDDLEPIDVVEHPRRDDFAMPIVALRRSGWGLLYSTASFDVSG